jgi:hypothetical protein
MAGPANRPGGATPPGLNVAHSAACASPPPIARSTTEIQPADFGGVYMAGATL